MQYELISKNKAKSINISNKEMHSLFFEKNLVVELNTFQFIPENPEKQLYSTHRYWYQTENGITPIKNVKYMQGTYFLAFDAHMTGLNHSHFIQQIFLSILIGKKYGVDFKRIPILINKLDIRKKELLSFLGDLRFIEVDFQKHAAILIENAIFSQTLFTFCTAPELANLYTEFRDTLALPNSQFTDKIYLSRKDSKNRKAQNEDEVIQYMQKRGFSIVELGYLSIKEQIATLAHAKTIVGAHGASGANLYFADDNVTFVELFSEARVDPCHAKIAMSKNCLYNATLNALSEEVNSTFAPDTTYYIDMDLLEKALDSPRVALQSSQKVAFFQEFSYSDEELFETRTPCFSTHAQLRSYVNARIEKLGDYLPKGLSEFYQSCVFFHKDDLKKSIEYCKKACELEENNIYFMRQLLKLYVLDLDAKSLLKTIQQTSKLFPAWGEPYYQLSLVYFICSDTIKALHFAREAIEREPYNEMYITHFELVDKQK